MNSRVFREILSGVSLIAALSILFFLSWQAWQFPIFFFDGWFYHLPFAAYLWDIGGSTHNFISHGVDIYYRGYPKLGEWLQGLGWVLSGSIRGTVLSNMLVFACLLAYAVTYLRISSAYLIAAILAFPLVRLHFQSVYVDFLTACFLALELCAAFVLIRLLKLKKNRVVTRHLIFHSVVLSAGFAAACETKIMAITTATAIAGYVFLKILWLAYRRRRTGIRPYLLMAAIIALGAPLAAWQYGQNLVRYHNPFYPLVWSIGSVEFEGEHNPDCTTIKLHPGYLPIHLLTRPLVFAFSVTDLDWFISEVDDPVYRIDMWRFTDQSTTKCNSGMDVRTGGLYGPYVAALMVVFLVLLRGLWKISKSGHVRSVYREQMILFGLFTAVIIMTPMSHHLRLVLAWPFALVICTGMLLKTVKPGWIAYAELAACLMCLYTLNVLSYETAPYKQEAIDDNFRVMIQGAIDTGKVICIGDAINPRQFAFSAAVMGGNHVIISNIFKSLPPECYGDGHEVFYDKK